MKVRVTNIQRFCLNDGPGIRTTVFFKGCNLKCPWCANPENIEYEIQEFYNPNTNERGTFGYDIELEELERQLLKDESYYNMSQGGITFSGGEPLLQFHKLEPLLKRLKEKNIHLCVETALYVSKKEVEIALKYMDEFYIDIKPLEKQKNKEIINGEIEIYYDNIQKIFQEKKKVTFRIPVTKEYTMQKENIEEIVKLLKRYPPIKVELFKIHYLAKNKYESLGRSMKEYQKVEELDIKKIEKKIQELGIETEIISI